MDNITNGVHADPPPLIKVSGNHREIGRQIGDACTDQVRRSIEKARSLIAQSYETLELTWEGAQIQARKYIPFVQERYPQYVDELLGIAEGANISMDDLIVLNAMEGVTMDALHLSKCTSMAVNDQLTADGHVLVAHNEDWLPEDEEDVYLIHAAPDDEPAFLAMTYGGLLPNVGFNSAGLAQCCDTVYPTDSRIGIPRIFVSRAVLASTTLGEAISRAIVPHRAAGYNHLLAHESGELYNVEVSARRFAILYGHEDFLAHTNFYLDQNLQSIEDEPDELIHTRVRYYRACRLLRREELHTVKTLEAIQRDHINYPNSICDHLEDGLIPLDRQKTINALVIDLTAKAMHFAWGNPCQNNYHVYYLES
jgi:isopenicillin-N N-acyltransferase-like protein